MRAFPAESGADGASGKPLASTYSCMNTLVVPWLSSRADGYAFERGVIGYVGYSVCGASYARSSSATAYGVVTGSKLTPPFDDRFPTIAFVKVGYFGLLKTRHPM